MKNLNEIKKYLYKNKPIAVKQTGFIKDNIEYDVYKTFIDNKVIEFNIPSNESVNFEDEIKAQLLIRWIK